MYNFTHQLPRVADPAFSNNYNTLPYAQWVGRFDSDEIDKFDSLFGGADERIALVGIDEGKVDTRYRNQYSKLLEYGEQSREMFEAVREVVDSLNYYHFNFALWAMEDIEQCICPVGSHFDVHVDRAPSPFRTERKLTCIVGMSSADSYDGGTLKILSSGNSKYATTIKLDVGDVVVIPSWTPYAIDKVTSGTLKYATTWLTGPKFA